MESVLGFFEWIRLTINSVLSKLGLPTNIMTQIGILIALGLILFLILDFIPWFVYEIKRISRSKDKKRDQVKKKKNDNKVMKKIADLYCYEIVPTYKGSPLWERTNKGIRGMYLVEKLDVFEKLGSGLLIFRFNGDWFYFRNPKVLSDYQIETYEIEGGLKERENSGPPKPEGKTKNVETRDENDFEWATLSLQILPQYRARYEVEVEGYYPHLIYNDKRVFLLLVKLKEEDAVLEDEEEKYYLFEDIELVGGISWQKRKVFLWTGDRLEKEQVSEIKKDYLDEKVEKVKLDVEMMR